MYFHEQRKSQRMKARLQTLGRRSNHSRKPSKDLTKSTDTTQPPVNSAPRFNQPHKLSTDFTDNNTQPPPTFSEEEEDFRSGKMFCIYFIVRNLGQKIPTLLLRMPQ